MPLRAAIPICCGSTPPALLDGDRITAVIGTEGVGSGSRLHDLEISLAAYLLMLVAGGDQVAPEARHCRRVTRHRPGARLSTGRWPPGR